jgi:serine/threonine protein kinase/mono/diheme cytochrome c family protein
VSASETIDELLLRWQELRRQDPRPSIRELCADHPSLAEELASRVAAFESMEAMLGVGAQATDSGSGVEHGVHRHLAEKLLPLGYQLLELIDQGGMGVVYKATQVKLRRTVALKMIAGLRAGPKQLARFRVEIEAVARLQHPNIVQIHEVGEVDGHSFFAMEYVAGGTLADRLAAGPLPPESAAALLETLARAIHHAHSRGVVHRDLKPANILLSGGGVAGSWGGEQPEDTTSQPHNLATPKVSDFGLAKRLEADTDHTATGEVIGTPNYMAPEQAEGKTGAIGPACDVYALGAILYEALTGRPPFQAKTILETLRRVASEEARPPRRIRPAIPRDLEAVCLKCLEKHPGRRYPSAEALADDLRRFVTGIPVLAAPLTFTGRVRKWSRRHPAWTALILLMILVPVTIAGWEYAKQEYEHRRKVRRAIEVAPQAREILHRLCFDCHGKDPAKTVEEARGFFVLDRGSLFDPERNNVVPGHPEESRLMLRIADGTMPPQEEEVEYPRVSQREQTILKEWIAGGAPPFPPEDPHNPTPTVVPYSELAARAREIFLDRCYECHRYTTAKGKKGNLKSKLRVLDHELLVVTRKVVVPGMPDKSELYRLIVATDPTKVMPPPDYPPLSPEEIEAVRAWIEAGAPPFPRTPSK